MSRMYRFENLQALFHRQSRPSLWLVCQLRCNAEAHQKEKDLFSSSSLLPTTQMASSDMIVKKPASLDSIPEDVALGIVEFIREWAEKDSPSERKRGRK